jgi:hypothetical protein
MADSANGLEDDSTQLQDYLCKWPAIKSLFESLVPVKTQHILYVG